MTKTPLVFFHMPGREAEGGEDFFPGNGDGLRAVMLRWAGWWEKGQAMAVGGGVETSSSRAHALGRQP